MQKVETAVETAKTESVKEVIKPMTVSELEALVKSGDAAGPFRGFEVEKSKAYRNLVGGWTSKVGGKVVTYVAHPEDAAAFRRSKVTGEILVWKLPAEGKVATVRKCASGSGEEIVVRTSDICLKRFAPDAKPTGARSSGKSSKLVAEEDPAV